MKILSATPVGMASLFASNAALAQSGNMMDSGMGSGGWMWGYGGMWTLVLLCIVVIALVVWIVRRGSK
jgi:hypothetical protein